MDSEQKIEERQKWNAPFLRAFNYLLECYEVTKGELCKMMGIQPGLISNYAKGTKKVSLDTMNALARVSNNTPGGMLNVNYMLGKSKYMLLSNVPDEEILEEYNPDREVLEKRKAAPRTPDMSSYINALLAKSDETIASLKRELEAKDGIIKAKDDQIAMMQESIATKDDYIATLKSRITELSNIIDSQSTGVPDFITPGVAKKPSIRSRK
jgi:transcriptional regulator with XRE-family HTH domain